MVTYSPVVAGFIRRTTWELAFVDAKYSHARSDNNFSVGATLEVFDEVEVDVPNVIDPPPDAIPFLWFNGPVYAILPYGKEVYVSGRFTKYGRPDLGWNAAPGICKIKSDGQLDPAFDPGDGFSIQDGYYPPTQLQGATDGGVFAGVSYAFLPEPVLYENRGGVSIRDRMNYNGTDTPPLIKIGPSGARDTAFMTDYLVDIATTPKFHSFHMFEVAGRCYTTFDKDVVAHSLAGVNYGGDDFAVLECRNLAGGLLRRASRRTKLSNSVPDFHMVYIGLEPSPQIFWAGQVGGGAAAGVVLSREDQGENIVEPIEWLMPENLASSIRGVSVHDPDLNPAEPPSWAGYDNSTLALGSTFAPKMITRGCFVGSIVGSFGVTDDDVNEGKWRNSLAYTYKGGLHWSFSQSWAVHSESGGGGVGNGQSIASLTQMGEDCLCMFYGGTDAGSVMALVYDKDGPNEQSVGGGNGGESSLIFLMPDGHPSGVLTADTTADDGIVWKFRLCSPAFRPTTGPLGLWNLRSGAPEDEPQNHGFSVFFGAVYDYDSCDNVRVLKSMWDSSRSYAAEHLPNADIVNLGIFFTGMIEKFKGVTVATSHDQLFKILHNGNLDVSFLPPIFGPDLLELFKDIEQVDSEDTPEVHRNKINCGVISAGGNVIYIGGKFTRLLIGEEEVEVGHICCLDVITGERLG